MTERESTYARIMRIKGSRTDVIPRGASTGSIGMEAINMIPASMTTEPGTNRHEYPGPDTRTITKRSIQ